MKRFPIFQKYTLSTCQKILEKSDIVEYQLGQELFHQKEDLQHFFILFKGVVSIWLGRNQYPGVDNIVKTVYDGAAIGEMSYFDEQADILDKNLIKSLSEQKNTAIAVQNSWVLKVNKKLWNQLKSSNQNEFSEILMFLRQCKLFEGFSTPNLVPLAQNLEFVNFKLGQPIIKQGIEPKGIFFIFKGICKVGINQKSIQQK